MAEFTPNKLNISEINGGEQYGETIVQANEFNSIIEGVLYSQDGVTSNTKDINNLYAIVDSGSLVTKTEVEDSYLGRRTGGTLDIIDGALTRVEKIEGDTIKCENVLKESITTVLTNTHNGITYTYDTTTGVLNANGTSTGVSLFWITQTSYQANKSLLSGTYTASIVDGSTSSHYLEVEWCNKETNAWVGGKQVSSTPVTFTVPSDCFLRIQVRIPAGVTVSNKKIYVMLNRGSTALPYQPFFNGLVSTSFKGVKSRGRNLIDIDKLVGKALVKNTDGTYTITRSSSDRISITNDMYIATKDTVTDSSGYTLIYCKYDIVSSNAVGKLRAEFFYVDGTRGYASFDTSSTGVLAWLKKDVSRMNVYLDSTEVEGAYITFKNSQIYYKANEYSYEPYEEDASFSLDSAVTLDKWDYIDVKRKKLVRQTITITNGNGITDEQKAQYDEYVVSGDNTIMKAKVLYPTETDIDIPDDYVARLNGVELIDDTGRTYTDLMVANNSVPKPKITQTYYTKV